LIAAAIRAGDTSKLPEVLEIVQVTGGMNYTLECAQREVNLALEQLRLLPDNNYSQAMRQLAEFALARSY